MTVVTADIPNYPGYCASKCGKIFEKTESGLKELRQRQLKTPYGLGAMVVNLKSLRLRAKYVSHMVYEAFRGPRGNRPLFNQDKDKTNNALENLGFGEPDWRPTDLSDQYLGDEIFRAVKDYPGFWVSSKGRVASGCKLKDFMFYSLHKTKDGKPWYPRIALFNEKGKKYFSVHRLVAAAFIPGDTSLQVNHKDLNKQNNHVENLEWVTELENRRHAYAMGAMDSFNGIKFTEAEVLQAVALLKNAPEGSTISEIARGSKFSRSQLARINRGAGRRKFLEKMGVAFPILKIQERYKNCGGDYGL